MARISYSEDGATIFAWLEGLQEGYTSAIRTCTWKINNTRIQTQDIANAITNTADDKIQWDNVDSQWVTIVCSIDAPGWTNPVKLAADPFWHEAPIPRPSEYYWTYEKNRGEEFNLTAKEWNGLLDNIKEVLDYKGINRSGLSFTTVNRNDVFTHNHYNEAVLGIQAVPGYGGYLHQVNVDDIITADQLNLLISELNVIS